MSSTGHEAILALDDVSVEIRRGDSCLPVLRNVTFSIGEGEAVGIVGQSGSGKSILARSVISLLPKGAAVVGGRICFDGRDISRMTPRAMRSIRGAQIGLIFQDPMSSLNPAFTVGEQVAEVVRNHRGLGRRQAWLEGVRLLDVVGIPSAGRRAHDYPHAFSGGMRQRVAVATSLAAQPRLLIADEPTTALDVTVQARLLETLRTLREEFGMALLMISHDIGVIAETVDRVIVMYAGQVVEQGDIESILRQPRHPYTAGLVSSVPVLGSPRGSLTPMTGSAPGPEDRLPGCRFEPRCRYSVPEICTRPPEVTQLRGGSVRCWRADELSLALECVPRTGDRPDVDQ